MPIAVPSQYETLSAMITPAIFLTANASLIISTSNRMSRVVDRNRVLNDLVDKLDGNKTELDYTSKIAGASPGSIPTARNGEATASGSP